MFFFGFSRLFKEKTIQIDTPCTLYRFGLPQLTEQGDQSLQEVTAQSGLARIRVSASGEPGQVASDPAQLRRSVVST